MIYEIRPRNNVSSDIPVMQLYSYRKQRVPECVADESKIQTAQNWSNLNWFIVRFSMVLCDLEYTGPVLFNPGNYCVCVSPNYVDKVDVCQGPVFLKVVKFNTMVKLTTC